MPGSEMALGESDAGGVTLTARQARILVAEDDEDLRDLIAAGLRQDGYAVEAVGTGYALLAASSRTRGPRFDLVISDVQLPGLTGLEVVAGLRNPERPVPWSTPVLFMTAFGDAETYDEARRLRARIFDKPFELDDLRTCVANLVDPLVPADWTVDSE